MKTLNDFADLLQTTFNEAAIHANQTSQAVKRVRKFTPVSLAQSFVLAFLSKPQARPEDVADTAACLGMSVSPQAVSQRYQPQLRIFFETLFEQMVRVVVGAEKPFGALLERFTEVRLIDSSVVMLPESQVERYPGCGGSVPAAASSLKLQTELDLRSGRLHTIQIEPGKLPDQATDLQHIEPPSGSLRITDLGYFNLAVFAMIHAAGAYFLSRTQYTVLLHLEGTSINLIKWLCSEGSGQVDREVVLGTKNRLRCRLIAWRVPDAIAAKRRRKLRETNKRRGRTVSDAALASCDWEYLITNVSSDRLSFKEAIVLYRSRWQIELLFKRWKSSCRIDLFDGRDDEMSMTRFWIRMCAAILQHWLVVVIGWAEATKISLAKLAKLIPKMGCSMAASWKRATTKDLINFLHLLQRRARVRCKPTKRRRKPSTVDLLNNPEMLDYCLT